MNRPVLDCPYGTHRDKEIMQKPNGGDETKTRDETTTVMPCTNLTH